MSQIDLVKKNLSDKIPSVVGAVADLGGLAGPKSGCDIVELRLDSLGHEEVVHNFAQSSPLPLLMTARGPLEGGQSQWSPSERSHAYRELFPHTTLLDIELRDFEALAGVIEEARSLGIIIIGSYHNFEITPALSELIGKFDHQADIYKFALTANSTADLATHLKLLESKAPAPLSVMGMGPLGAAARPLMAKAGSALNYGFLGKTPTAPNQWPAELLAATLKV